MRLPWTKPGMLSYEQIEQLKLRAIRWAVLGALALALCKFAAAWATHSLVILASGVDSALDFFVSFLNLLSLKKSFQPADHDHRYGHGKAESLAGLFQAFMIAASSFYLIYLSAQKIAHGSRLEHLGLGLWIMVLSTVVSYALGRELRQAGTRTASSVLKADSLHYDSDVYANAGILVSLGVIRVTGWTCVDPAASVGVALYILWLAWSVAREAMDELMDRQLPENDLQEVERIVHTHAPQIYGLHGLRTRRAGPKKFIEFRMWVDENLTFREAHDLTESVAREIEERIPLSEVLIHTDPYSR